MLGLNLLSRGHGALASLAKQAGLVGILLAIGSSSSSAQHVLSGEEARAVAREKGWIIRSVTPSGQVMALQQIVNGKPRYYITHNRVSADSIATDECWPGGSTGFALDGTGVRLGIWDGGSVRTGHQEFGGRVIRRDGSPFLNDFHATHVGGTMIAAGVSPAAKGMSFAAMLDSYDWDFDVTEMRSAAGAGLRISNHSYGLITGWIWAFPGEEVEWIWFGDTTVSAIEDYEFGFYSFESADWDAVAYARPNYLIVKSAGNDRDEGPPPGTPHFVFVDPTHVVISTATRNLDGNGGYDSISHASLSKNILTVGAVQDVPGGYSNSGRVAMSAFSCWGPADDGRIKPDIVANGVGLTSAIGASNSSYASFSGTSMASPSVSGSVGLLLQYYRDTHEEDTEFSAAAMKALVIHTADECGIFPGPDYSFGWGLMNTAKAANLIDADAADPELLQRLSLSNGASFSMTRRAAGTTSLRVTIVWTDPPGTQPPPALDPSTRALVNDLDLRITGPTGTVHMPWTLNRVNPSGPAAPGDNIVDNVEVIDIPTPLAGDYVVRVAHKGTLFQSPAGRVQEFALVISGFVVIPPVVGACCSSEAPFECLEGRTEGQCRARRGVYGGDNSTCAEMDCDRCDDPICQFCWIDTALENNCPQSREGDGFCDCGCQFEDIDCLEVPIGACCSHEAPYDCTDDVLRHVCQTVGGAFRGTDTTCATIDCDRCDLPNCARCWIGTLSEGDCDEALRNDGLCDCGCDFFDPDCGCGDGHCLFGEDACSCPEDCDAYCGDACCSHQEKRRTCGIDCMDLRDFASLARCFTGPDLPRSFSCQEPDYEEDGDVDLDDYKRFKSNRFGGP